jgi:hypothetical protein
MPFQGLISGSMGYGRAQPQQQSTPFDSNTPGPFVTAGNGAANLNTSGMTSLAAVAGQDDISAQLAVAMPYAFFGTQYGNSSNGGIWWNTNQVFVFGSSNATINWLSNTAPGICVANSDRRTNTLYYSGVNTASGFSNINYVVFYQNNYNDSIPNAVQWQMRLFTNGLYQYLEVRASTAPSTAGLYTITNGTTFQNTFSGFTNVTAGSSFVLQADAATGTFWKLFNNYRVNL